MHHDGVAKDSENVILSSTRLYDFYDPYERGEWLDILIALIEYLRSGESRIGFLNNSVPKNMLHKNRDEDIVTEEIISEVDCELAKTPVSISKIPLKFVVLIAEETSVALRRSNRKRRSDDDAVADRNVKSRR